MNVRNNSLALMPCSISVFTEKMTLFQHIKDGKTWAPPFCPIYSTATAPLLYCSCCLGTTGYIFSCCSGMCLIQSDSQAVSACLSRPVRNPAGFCLTVCLFLQDPGLFSWNAWKMQPSSLSSNQYFCCFSTKKPSLIFSICWDLIGLYWHIGA